MFLIKFFYFLKGYVIIKADGKSVLDFINECTAGGLRLYNIIYGEGVQFTVCRNDFFRLMQYADATETHLNIIKKCGIVYILNRHRKRTVFFAGAVLFVLFIAVSSGFLWDIRIEGNESIKNEQVLNLLHEIGVKPGVHLSKLPDAQEMKDHLIGNLDNVPWAWVYIEGVRARVVIHEGIVPPVVADDSVPCDIIASRPGFVTGVSVKKGKALCMAGNAVVAGEVLISGYIDPTEMREGYEVHADGEIMAVTSYTESADYSIYEDRPKFTGNEKSVFEITLFSKTFSLFKPPEYNYSIKKETVFSPGIFSGRISVKQIKYMEAEKNRVQLPLDWITEFAKRDLSARISEKLGSFARLISQEYTVSENGSTVNVTANMEFTESIGVCVPR